MRTLAHLSDPHFGRVERATVQALIATVTEARPDIVVVSGDFTQRAKEREFQEARQFLEALPSPQIVVPGNHDVPLHNVLARALQPSKDLEPFYCDDEIAIVGINTARSPLRVAALAASRSSGVARGWKHAARIAHALSSPIIPSICPKRMSFMV